ncbi:biotin operon repressor [Pyrococcus kukulkanii]|uniref:biotin operon repressor n=1 Tax=Pyrococcus kukulkanii TaxID=1609559 RepID=UPI003563F05B
MRCIKPELKAKILRMLREGTVSGERIARELGMSRVAVWKHVKTLSSVGYVIETTAQGYQLIKTSDFPFPWEIGVDFLYCRKAKSTMDIVWRSKYEGAIAEEQTGGRGSRGRWISPRGGLYFSVRAPGLIDVNDVGNVIANALGKYVDVENEGGKLYVDGKKIGGIILEVRGSNYNIKAVLGVGINVNNPVPPGATSLMLEIGEKVSLREVGEIVIKSVIEHLKYTRGERA